MSNIVKNKDDLMLLKDIFEEIKNYDVDACLLEEIVKSLLPKDNNGDYFSGYEIYDIDGGLSRFSLTDNILILSIDEMNRWIDGNILRLIKGFNVSDIELFRSYLFLLVIIHEIEHSYQYLMAYGLIDAPCEFVGSGYRLIIDTIVNRDINKLKRLRNSIAYYLYSKNDGLYVIERNANVEAFDLLQNLAIENDNVRLGNVFNRMRNAVAMSGYMDNNMGSFYETIMNMRLGYEYKKLNHNYQLSDIERFRYGLPISEEFRKKIKIIKKYN